MPIDEQAKRKGKEKEKEKKKHPLKVSTRMLLNFGSAAKLKDNPFLFRLSTSYGSFQSDNRL